MPWKHLPFTLLCCCVIPISARSQSLASDLVRLSETPAVTGYEAPLLDVVEQRIRATNPSLHPSRDALGNLTLTFGSGAPRRLIATSVDEPGYVICQLQPDGYARLQRLPQAGLPPHWNELNNAQPMWVQARDGKLHSAILSGLSIHLQPGRADVPDPDDLDHVYLDLGAASAEEARSAGIDVLSPVAAERHLFRVGTTQWTGTAVGDRYGAALLLSLADTLARHPGKGTTTLAFVVQQWAGTRGLTRLVDSMQLDEVIYLGRNRPVTARPTVGSAPEGHDPPAHLGSGTIATSASGTTSATHDPLEQEFSANPGVPFSLVAPILARTYGPAVSLPGAAVHLSVPLLYATTAAETLDERDLSDLLSRLARHLGLSPTPIGSTDLAPLAYAPLPSQPTETPRSETLLKTLVEAYGVSEQERMSREAVERLLPPWAHPATDYGGNLILRLGSAATAVSDKPDGIVFMAHTDELGFRVRAIHADGTLELDNKGGGSPAFFWGHPALIHSANGMHAGVVTLPADWDTPGFKFPADFRSAATMYVGASSAEDVAKLGIIVGDQVTIPKRYRTLLGKRISARSLDDRVGCAAMLRAVWELGPNTTRNVTFVWSTREELGLLGAGEYAAQSFAQGKTPATVFAIDTFVSSDSPIESHRFADAPLGAGFVIRAIDNSNIASWPLVQRVQAIATQHHIPAQYGVTGGGNDGASFQRFGSSDVPLSWPLRYSHSPGEVIDLRDLDSLSAIVTALARDW